MVKIDIAKDGLGYQEEFEKQDNPFDVQLEPVRIKTVSRVDIDTSSGDIDVYVDGEQVRQKRYALRLDGVEANNLYVYKKRGYWAIGYFYGQMISTDSETVSQRDIDTAPDWVKVLRKVEVKP